MVVAPYLCAVATTIELGLLRGLLTAIAVPETLDGMAVKVICETDKGRVLALIPRLMVGAPTDGVLDVPEARRLELFGSYTLDGEAFLDRRPSAARTRVTVSRANETIEAIAL